MCQEFNIENDIIPQIATCFGGGIGGTGSVCGAVAGGVMAIGLLEKRGITVEEWKRVADIAREFRSRFEAEMGAINCRDLIGVDLTTDTGSEELMNSDIPMTVCLPAVDLAYRLVVDLMAEES